MGKKGYLHLENGQMYEGYSFGSENSVSGEIVFNTGMTGYPESFTDPSYKGQILVATYPLIGNYGVPSQKFVDNIPFNYESDRAQIAALIVSTYVNNNSHWNAEKTLAEWLKKEHVPAISGIDSRSLTQTIREKGVMKAIVTIGKSRQSSGLNFTPLENSSRLAAGYGESIRARGSMPLGSSLTGFKDINKDNLVAQVSCKKSTTYGSGKIRILFFDCGAKLNQIRLLFQHDTSVLRVPWDYNPFRYQPKSLQQGNQGLTPFDVIMISNGPGDPKLADKTIHMIREALKREIPILGVCLGNQILALAAGADTYKLSYGHRGQNQPVQDVRSGKCYITTQNHGFAVDTNTIPKGWTTWFTNLNDGTNEGIRHETLPFFSTQFHPEDTPGPTDTRWIFDYFLKVSAKWLKRKAK